MIALLFLALHLAIGIFASLYLCDRCRDAGYSDVFVVVTGVLAFVFWPLALIYDALDYLWRWIDRTG